MSTTSFPTLAPGETVSPLGLMIEIEPKLKSPELITDIISPVNGDTSDVPLHHGTGEKLHWARAGLTETRRTSRLQVGCYYSTVATGLLDWVRQLKMFSCLTQLSRPVATVE